MAWRYHVRPPQKRSRREKPKNDKKTQTSLREYKQDMASQEESTSKIASDKEEYYQS